MNIEERIGVLGRALTSITLVPKEVKGKDIHMVGVALGICKYLDKTYKPYDEDYIETLVKNINHIVPIDKTFVLSEVKLLRRPVISAPGRYIEFLSNLNDTYDVVNEVKIATCKVLQLTEVRVSGKVEAQNEI